MITYFPLGIQYAFRQIIKCLIFIYDYSFFVVLSCAAPCHMVFESLLK